MALILPETDVLVHNTTSDVYRSLTMATKAWAEHLHYLRGPVRSNMQLFQEYPLCDLVIDDTSRTSTVLGSYD